MLPGEVYDGSTPLPDLKQEFFCELYTASFTTYYGHGQNSYAFSYSHQKRIDALKEKLIGASTTVGRGKNRKPMSDQDRIKKNIMRIEHMCRTSATKLLIRTDIRARIDWKLDQAADDKIMDKEAMRVVQQMHNLDAKMRAIERFDKVRGRIREKIDIKHEFEPVEVITITVPIEK